MGAHLFSSLFASWRRLARHKDYIISQAHAERTASLAGHVFGALWFVLRPLLEMLTYYLLIVVFFRRGNFGDYPVFLGIMTGIIHYHVFQQMVSQSVMAIVSQRHVMLQVPIEPMAFVAISALRVLLDARYYVPLYVAALLLYGVWPPPTVVWYPFVLALLLLASWAVSLLVAVAYVYFRDIREITSVALRLLFYLCPTIYPVTYVPKEHLGLYLLNPFATLFNLIQATLLGMPFPPLPHVLYCVTFFVLLLGLAHLLYSRAAGNMLKVM